MKNLYGYNETGAAGKLSQSPSTVISKESAVADGREILATVKDFSLQSK